MTLSPGKLTLALLFTLQAQAITLATLEQCARLTSVIATQSLTPLSQEQEAFLRDQFFPYVGKRGVYRASGKTLPVAIGENFIERKEVP